MRRAASISSEEAARLQIGKLSGQPGEPVAPALAPPVSLTTLLVDIYVTFLLHAYLFFYHLLAAAPARAHGVTMRAMQKTAQDLQAPPSVSVP